MAKKAKKVAIDTKPSVDWLFDPMYVGLNILEPVGWDKGDDNYEYSFYLERISREEFELRLMDSVLERGHLKL